MEQSVAKASEGKKDDLLTLTEMAVRVMKSVKAMLIQVRIRQKPLTGATYLGFERMISDLEHIEDTLKPMLRDCETITNNDRPE